MNIYTRDNITQLKSIPILDNNQIYIYVIENYSQGNIKIGKTTNIQQRIKALSGSNSGGNKIVKCYCSPATFIMSMENTCHIHYEKYRIKGTEWFSGEYLNFNEVVDYIDGLFHSKSYYTCNELRRQLSESSK